MNDKPNAQRYGWQLLETRYPFQHPVFSVRQDLLRWPDGHEQPFAYVEEKRPAVFILPVTSAGEIVLIRQYRYIADAWFWELPAGGTHDYIGDDWLGAAQRELHQEVGGTSERWQQLNTFRPGIGLLDMEMHLFIAWDVQLSQADPELWEKIEIHPLPKARALEMARDGTIVDALSAYCLLRCESIL